MAGALAVATSAGTAAGVTNAVVLEDKGKLSAAATNRLAFRLANTPKKIAELSRVPHAILLENAFVDTEQKVDLNIPKHLRAAGDPGAYIV